MTEPTLRQKKSDRTRAAILDAARALFAERGYEATTVRDIAAAAAIDPAMVIRYFGSKDELFARAAPIDLALPPLTGVPAHAIGEALMRRFIEVWETGPSARGMVALMRTAATSESAVEKAHAVFGRQVLPAVAAIGDPRDAPRRAGLVASQLLGLAFTRYVLALPPVVALSSEELVAAVAPTIQRYITG